MPGHALLWLTRLNGKERKEKAHTSLSAVIVLGDPVTVRNSSWRSDIASGANLVST
jgi:hypothetical protein